MDASFSALIGVLGTLLGAAMAYKLQEAAAVRADGMAKAELRRQELLSAITDFVATLNELRRVSTAAGVGQGHGNGDSEDVERVEASAWTGLIRLRLLVGDGPVILLAQEAIRAAVAIKSTSNDAERAQADHQCLVAFDALIAGAAARLEP